jgi:hypothetical protein
VFWYPKKSFLVFSNLFKKAELKPFCFSTGMKFVKLLTRVFRYHSKAKQALNTKARWQVTFFQRKHIKIVSTVFLRKAWMPLA